MTEIDLPGRLSTNNSSHLGPRIRRQVALLAVVASSFAAVVLAIGGVAMAADPVGSAGSEQHAHSAAGAALDLSSYHIVTGAPTEVPPHGRTNAGVLCPAGTQVLGGGEHNNSVSQVLLTDSYPVANGSGWQTVVINNGPTAQTATAYAVCGK